MPQRKTKTNKQTKGCLECQDWIHTVWLSSRGWVQHGGLECSSRQTESLHFTSSFGNALCNISGYFDKWASSIWAQLSPQSDVTRQNVSPKKQSPPLGLEEKWTYMIIFQKTRLNCMFACTRKLMCHHCISPLAFLKITLTRSPNNYFKKINMLKSNC